MNRLHCCPERAKDHRLLRFTLSEAKDHLPTLAVGIPTFIVGTLHRSVILFSISVLFTQVVIARQPADSIKFFAADHPYIQYTGRVDFTNPKLPRFWQPGVYITAKFEGDFCEIILNDEMLWGTFHNYVEVVVDGNPIRLQTKTKRDTIQVAQNLSSGIHTVSVY